MEDKKYEVSVTYHTTVTVTVTASDINEAMERAKADAFEEFKNDLGGYYIMAGDFIAEICKVEKK